MSAFRYGLLLVAFCFMIITVTYGVLLLGERVPSNLVFVNGRQNEEITAYTFITVGASFFIASILLVIKDPSM